ncbi:MAG TPA: hypothetical protein VMW53_07080 [archaeon]|nr:hypothetical protein [archaeon]HUW66608.1 hypothetical protein [Candidatus Nanoarchaeia archaeon]
MKVKQLYDDFSVDYALEGHKNVRDGWIGVDCPFCVGKSGYHLGYNMDDDYFSCWRCGKHSAKEVLTKLLNVDEKTTRILIKQYGGSDSQPRISLHRDTKPFTFPTNCGPLQYMHELYLLGRGFDPNRLARDWGLQGTGPISNLDGADYRFRIIAPIQWNEDIVSFQGRSISDHAEAKYKACPINLETIHHKHILYGNQTKWKSTGIVVEGITDVWRFGSSACATFGIKYKREQLRIIVKSFTRVFIVFDPEPQAQQQAEKMRSEIYDFISGPEVHIVSLQQDPGSMDQDEANYLIKQLTS